MTRSPLAAAFVGLSVALAAAQMFTPTAQAAPKPAPKLTAASDYRVRILSQTVTHGAGGLVIRGRILNTGRRPLTYTLVTSESLSAAGRPVFQGHGYLTVSPLLPGRSAEYRVCEPDAPASGAVQMSFRESGRPVAAELVTKAPARLAQAAEDEADSHSTTVR